MGCGLSRERVESRGDIESIQSVPRQNAGPQKKEIKILMLGTGDSGKSTVLKQLKLITAGSYTEEERSFFKTIIFTNIVESMQAILEAMDLFGIQFASPSNATSHAAAIMSRKQRIAAPTLPSEVHEGVQSLWADPGVRACFSRCNEFQVCDSAMYYFDNIDRIASEDYVPSDQDILRSRQKTTGVVEFSFTAKDNIYRIIDVGGQRSERKKWIHQFEDVDLVLFLVALSEYDQSLYEDGSANRLQEALDLFQNICQSPWFTRTAIQLVFNKTDLFLEKLKHSPLDAYFPDFQGGSDYPLARQYIADKFTSIIQKRYQDNYICATDTVQVRMLMRRLVEKI